jgi:hypothetical protein
VFIFGIYGSFCSLGIFGFRSLFIGFPYWFFTFTLFHLTFVSEMDRCKFIEGRIVFNSDKKLINQI